MYQKYNNTHWRFFVYRFDDELLIIEGNVSDLTPGEANLWGQPGEEITKVIITATNFNM